MKGGEALVRHGISSSTKKKRPNLHFRRHALELAEKLDGCQGVSLSDLDDVELLRNRASVHEAVFDERDAEHLPAMSSWNFMVSLSVSWPGKLWLCGLLWWGGVETKQAFGGAAFLVLLLQPVQHVRKYLPISFQAKPEASELATTSIIALSLASSTKF